MIHHMHDSMKVFIFKNLLKSQHPYGMDSWHSEAQFFDTDNKKILLVNMSFIIIIEQMT